MKFSSLFLFITLLIILIVIVLFSKFYPSLEGMVSFNSNLANDNTPIKILMYSQTNPIVKIYDHIYYDHKNANVIELDVSTTPAGTAREGETQDQRLRREQTVINKVYVTDRNNITHTYTSIPPLDSAEEKSKVGNTRTSISSSKDPFEFTTKSLTTNKYQILYFPLGTYTIITVLDLEDKIICRSIFHYSTLELVRFDFTNSIGMVMASPTGNDDPNNGKDVIVTKYDGTKKIFQLSKNVWIDKTNGYYIIENTNGQTIYDGKFMSSGNVKSSFRTQNNEIALYVDKSGYLVIYVGLNNFIGLYILAYNTTEQKFKIDKNIVIDINVPNTSTTQSSGSSSSSSGSSGSSSSSSSGKAEPPTDNLGPYSDYYRWLAYWNATGKTGIFSTDYIEKTQIVPPVCPACPTCPSSGVCTNCGGNGGSGTSNVQQQQQQPQQPGIVRSVADTTGRTITGVVDTTADVLKSTGSGTADLLKSAGSGTTDLLKSAGSGTVDLLKSAGSGTYDFITGKWLDENGNEQPANGRTPPQRASISGAQPPYGGGNRGNQQFRDGGGQGAGRMVPPDNYNYNGALTEKGGNFIPVTTDFSAFGR